MQKHPLIVLSPSTKQQIPDPIPNAGGQTIGAQRQTPLLPQTANRKRRLKRQSATMVVRVPGPIAITILVLYTFACIFIVYFCLIADPRDSEIAHFVQTTLPQVVWNRLHRICGDTTMHVLKHISDRIMVLAYFTLVGGCWFVVFADLYPWLLYDSPGLSNVHAAIGIFVFLACFGAWAVANSSRPGIITARNFRRYDHYPYDHLMFEADRKCGTTGLSKIPRCKYDRIKYDGLVPRYDHFCGWTNNTYGEENYRWFLTFLLNHVIMCFYGTYVCYLLFSEELRTKRLLELTFFDRTTGNTIQASYYMIFQYMFARRTHEIGLTFIMLFMGIALACFLGYHVYITSIGQTTNENGKWGDVQKWHKEQKRLYEKAVQKGKLSTKVASKSDGGGKNDETSNDDSEKQVFQELMDPGPTPKNLYNRGFVANWKEVFFPLSLRKDALSLGGCTAAIQKDSSSESPKKNFADTGTSTLACQTSSSINSSVRSTKPKDI